MNKYVSSLIEQFENIEEPKWQTDNDADWQLLSKNL